MDDPQGSRLFLVCGRSTEEDNLRAAFSEYGAVEHVKVIKEKGVAYVKFDKASSAARAMENLNGAVLNNGRGPQLKVLLADSPDSSGRERRALSLLNQDDPNEQVEGKRGLSYARYNDSELSSDPDNVPPRSRLFIVVPKNADANKIQEKLSSYPGMEYCKTDLIASKGVVFCKYNRASTALQALEHIKELGMLAGYKVKCMLAEPKVKKVVSDVVLPDGATSIHSGMRSPLGSRCFEPAYSQAAAAAHAFRMRNTPSPSAGFSSLRSSFESQHLRNSTSSLPSPNALSLSADFHSVGNYGHASLAGLNSGNPPNGNLSLSASGVGALGNGIPTAFLGLGLDGGAVSVNNSGSFISNAGSGAALGHHQTGLHGPLPGHALNSAAAAAAAGSLGSLQGLGSTLSPSPSLANDLSGLSAVNGLAGLQQNMQQGLNLNLASLVGNGTAPGNGMAALGNGGTLGASATMLGSQALMGAPQVAAAAAAAHTPAGPTASMAGPFARAPMRQRLFVVVHKGASREQIARLFKRFDGMEYCDLKVDRNSGKSKGYCYVNYSSAEMAAAAIEAFNGIEFPPGSGQRLKVMYAEPLSASGRISNSSSARSSTTSVGMAPTAAPPSASPRGGDGGRLWPVEQAELAGVQDSMSGMDLTATRSSVDTSVARGPSPGIGGATGATSSRTAASAAGEASSADTGTGASASVSNSLSGVSTDEGVVYTFLSRPLPFYAIQHFFLEQVGAVEWVKLNKDDERYGTVKFVNTAHALKAVRKLSCSQIMGEELHVAHTPAPLHAIEESTTSSPPHSVAPAQ